MDTSQGQLDVVFVVSSIAACSLVVFIAYPENLDYVPLLVTGISLLAGILGGFSALLLSHMIGKAESERIKNWMHRRVKSTGVILFFGYMFIICAYGDLFADRLDLSFIDAIIGVFIIVFMFLRTLFYLNVKEKDAN